MLFRIADLLTLHKNTEMAELYETYPAMLKKASDPAQVPRKNIKHITDRFRGDAQRFLKKNPKNCFTEVRRQFAAVHFPIVPFDSLLENLFNTLERHPLTSLRNLIEPFR